MLELLYTSTKTIDVVDGSAKALFIASWDAVLYVGHTSNSDFRKVFKDGTAFIMGHSNAFWGNFLSATGGRGAASMEQDGAVNVALLDEISGLPMLGNLLNSVDMDGKIATGSFVDHVAGLVYTPSSGSTIKVYSLATGALTKTLTISGVTVYTSTVIQDAGASSLFLSRPGFAPVATIDRVTGAVTFTGTINADNRAAAYDSTHNVVIVVLETGQVAVYALNNVGSALSAVSFSPSPALYTLSKVTTRLTGADGQGIAGKTVLWWLTGDKGDLESPYTLTDEDGYAENWYYGPAGSHGLGSETINVEVTS